MEWYTKALKNGFVFAGRARRAEYWNYVVINLIAVILFNVIGLFIEPVNYLGLLYSLIVLVPGIAVGVRRLHDTGRSGKFLFLFLIPVIGTIIVLIFLAEDSQEGENQYGPNPKAVS